MAPARPATNIDLPNAGVAVIKGNTIEQGAKSQNPAMINYGGEGKGVPYKGSLLVEDNLFINHAAKSVGISNKTAPHGRGAGQ